jgi:hypothetical protein
MLEVISTSDPAKPFALMRRHRNAAGRMVDTIISTWPTKNAAHDALYAEIHGLRSARHPRLERVVTTGGTVAAVLTLAAVALAGGAWLVASTATADEGIERAAAPASYAITVDH